MKKNTHPSYQEVLFVDSSTGVRFVCGSTLHPKEREIFDGKEYPYCKVSISSASHPFYTGANQYVDSERRVDKFQKRYQMQPKVEKATAPDPVPEKKKGKAAAPKPVKKKNNKNS